MIDIRCAGCGDRIGFSKAKLNQEAYCNVCGPEVDKEEFR